MTKRRMLLVTGANVMVDTDLAALVHLISDEWDTVEFDPKTMRPKVAADYDAVLLSHAVSITGKQMAALVDATKPGRLFMHACDIQFTDRAPAGADRKPLTLIASLAPAIADTDEGKELAAKWIKPLHPESRVVFSEFLVGLVDTIGPETKAAADRAKDVETPAIRSFYWGIKRPGVIESLKSLGLGEHEDDAVFGAIASSFPKVRNLTTKDRYSIDAWAPFVVHAARVPLPYEAVKSEYQITRRLLECAYLAPDTTVADERLSDHVRRFLDPAEWVTYARQVSGELLDIFDEGLPSVKKAEAERAHLTDGLNLGPRLADDFPRMLGTLGHALSLKPKGTALEFGVGNGRSLRMIAEHMPVIGFDAWTGLPEKWRDGFDKGAFACDPPNVPGSILVPGLVQDTLPKWKRLIAAAAKGPGGIGLVHLDLDLESATAFVLREIMPLLKPGALILFDELHGWPGWENAGEWKAWREYTAAHPVDYEVIGHGPEQWLIRLTKAPSK